MTIERWCLLGHELSTSILNDERVGYNEHYNIIFAHFYFRFYFLTLQCKYKQNFYAKCRIKYKIWIGCFNNATGSTAGTRLSGQRILTEGSCVRKCLYLRIEWIIREILGQGVCMLHVSWWLRPVLVGLKMWTAYVSKNEGKEATASSLFFYTFVSRSAGLLSSPHCITSSSTIDLVHNILYSRLLSKTLKTTTKDCFSCCFVLMWRLVLHTERTPTGVFKNGVENNSWK